MTMDKDLLTELSGLAVKAAAPVTGPDGAMYLPVPNQMKLEKIVDPAPKQIRESPEFEAADSFCEYVREFKDRDGKTQLFASAVQSKFVAALDYHDPAAGQMPRLRMHFAHFSPRTDPVFSSWIKVNKQKQTQDQFAAFIEEHAVEILDPDAATMMEIATDLNLKVDITFSSRKNVSNGLVQIEYKEASDGAKAGGTGSITVPKEMRVKMPIYFGEAPIEFRIFLRYGVGRGEPLHFITEIHRLEYLHQEAFLAIADRIGQSVGLTPKLGLPSR